MSRDTALRQASDPVVDQAQSLRAMALQSRFALEAHTGSIAQRASNPALPTRRQARSIVVTSGKGGVGGSNFALNLAIALGQLGKRVVLVDADLGLANIDILCGLTPSAGLGDVVTGSSTLAEALMEGPAGIRIIAGSHGMHGLSEILGDSLSHLAEELADLASESDFVIIDAGSGLNAGISTLAESSDEVVVVTTPEPTSIADAQAVFGRLRRLKNLRLRLVVNQARTSAEGIMTLRRLQAGAREFSNTTVEPLGFVRFDPKVSRGVRERRPFTIVAPRAPASKDIRGIAVGLLKEAETRELGTSGPCWRRLRWPLSLLSRGGFKQAPFSSVLREEPITADSSLSKRSALWRRLGAMLAQRSRKRASG